MSKEEENKAVVGRWFKEFWGNPWNPDIVDELAAPDIRRKAVIRRNSHVMLSAKRSHCSGGPCSTSFACDFQPTGPGIQ